MSGASVEAILLALVNSAQVIMLAYVTRRTNRAEKRRLNGAHHQEELELSSAPGQMGNRAATIPEPQGSTTPPSE
jgi:hypothetical protein